MGAIMDFYHGLLGYLIFISFLFFGPFTILIFREKANFFITVDLKIFIEI